MAGSLCPSFLGSRPVVGALTIWIDDLRLLMRMLRLARTGKVELQKMQHFLVEAERCLRPPGSRGFLIEVDVGGSREW